MWQTSFASWKQHDTRESWASPPLPSAFCPLTSLSHAADVGEVAELAVLFQPVADENAVAGLEGAKVGFELDRAQIGTVEQRDQLQCCGLVLTKLGQKIRLDDAGRDDVLQHVDVLARQIDPIQKVDLHGVSPLRFR